MISKINSTDEILLLFNEYMHHMKQFFDVEDYDSWLTRAMNYLEKYNAEPNRHIFILEKEEKTIGFALVNTHLRFNSSGYAVAEFYIEKHNQNKGYGKILAEHVFSHFPGTWEVAVAEKNTEAFRFWKSVISSFSKSSYKEKTCQSYEGTGFVFTSA